MRSWAPRWALSVFLLGIVVSVISLYWFRHHPLRHSAPTYSSEAWEKLSFERRTTISGNHQRFSSMTPEQQRLIRDRWQFYRHLPPWRQAQMLRDYETWQKTNP